MEPAPRFVAAGSLHAGLAAGRDLRWAAGDLTAVVEEVRERLDLSPVAAATLGESLTAAALLIRLAAKVPTRLVLEIRGRGPLRRVVVEADHEGGVRGMVGAPRAEEVLPLRYRCRCSRERLLEHLVMLAAGDREHLRHEDGSTGAECVFCGAVYRFAGHELEPQ